jgi:hypothetical protein
VYKRQGPEGDQKLMLLDMLGKRYGRLPCEVIGIAAASPLGLTLNVLAMAEGRSMEAAVVAEGGPLAALAMGGM